MLLNHPLRSTGKTDESPAIFKSQPLESDFPASQVLVFHPASGKKLTERQITFVILAIDRQSIRIVPFAVHRIRDPQITPDNGLNAVSYRMRIETQGSEQVHRIGDTQCNASLLHHFFKDGVETHDTVLDGIFGVKTQMNEVGGHS